MAREVELSDNRGVHTEEPLQSASTEGTAGESDAANSLTANRLPNQAPRQSFLRRWRGALIATAIVFLVVVLGVAIPMPYVVESPGPTFDVLASRDNVPMIELQTKNVAPKSNGQLRMVTVSSHGGPGQHVTAAEVLWGWLSPKETVTPVSEIYPSDITQQQVEELAKAQMVNSQSTAAAAALEYLGYDVPAKITIRGPVAGTKSEGKVEDGDVLQAITTPDGVRHPVNRASVPFQLNRELKPGQTVTMHVLRNGKTKDVRIETYKPDNVPSDFVGSKFGMYLTADVKLPFPVKIHLEKVGGPSAGTMFALGIIDRLTGGKMVGDHVVAGTGTISYAGEVGPIGGIVQKMYGSRADGAQWFLAPRSNCDEVVGNVPDGLQVWPVSTLDEAVDAVAKIRTGDVAGHPQCAR